MEGIGLAVGVAGLAGLFSTCIDCFQLVQRGRYFGKEYLLLETKFANQRLRLLSWGRACGFEGSERYDERLDDEELRSCIEATLIHLIALFNDGKKLKSRYGLSQDQPQHSVLAIASSAVGTLIPRSVPSTKNLGERLHELTRKMSQAQKNVKVASTVRWAIEDGQKFTELIQHLKDLIDDLEGLTKRLDISERQRDIIQYEVESISEISTLEIIEEARWGKADAISDAASLRLWKVRDQYQVNERGGRPANLEQSPRASMCSTDIEWNEITHHPQNLPTEAADTRYQVLHRVSCEHEKTAIFLDPPSYSTWNGSHEQWVVLDTGNPLGEPNALHLRGRRTIPDLDAYLNHNCQLLFVVFKNYRCCHDANQRKNPDAPSFDQSVYLSSVDLSVAMESLCQRVTHLPRFPEFRPGVTLEAPYLWYYHSKVFLDMELSGSRAQKWEGGGAKTLLDFISESMAEEYSAVETLISQNVISWRFLPYLFAQGDIVLRPHLKGEDYHQAYELLEQPEVLNTNNEKACLTLRVCSWAFDGKFQCVTTWLNLHRSELFISGEKLLQITSLFVLPLRLSEDGICKRLENRGKAFWDYRHERLVSYSGLTADSKKLIRNGRFMVDASTYSQLHSSTDRLRDDLGDDTMASDHPPDGNFIFLLPPTIYGYDMDQHKWRKLLVSNTSYVPWNKDAFEQLVLDREQKDLLTAVMTSMKSNNKIDVSLDEKDHRLIMFFHGNPGSGKTFAASAIAEFTERPLYCISLSDIGTGVAEVERYFKSIDYVRTKWRCVVLLDDADSFLERREASNFEHNALFSVFIRFLERYNGTLILTSNRVIRFDMAFETRFQLALHFPVLDASGIAKVWRNVIRDLQKTNVVADFDELLSHIKDLSNLAGDGRKIRNAVKMAQQLAEFRRETLGLSHFETVTEASGSQSYRYRYV